MLMVIFGAGASYDSAQAYRLARTGGMGHQSIPDSRPQYMDAGGPWRPPLAENLFKDPHHVLGDIVGKYRRLSHILPYLREPSNGRTVEQMLEHLQEEGKDNPESQREFASVRYYLCELLHTVTTEWTAKTNGVTNYAPLIRDVLRFNRSGDRVCLVTFNYDTLLERALYTFDFKAKVIEQHFDSHPVLKLFRLHGSVRWCRFVDIPSNVRLIPQDLIEQADTIHISDNFVVADAANPSDMVRFGRSIFPAIAVPVQTKTEQNFECPLTHLSYLTEMLPRVTKILIIGWQAKEAHFLRMLRSKLPKLKRVMVVGGNELDASATLKYFLEEIGLNVADRIVGRGGFTDFIVNEEGLPFFKE